MKNIVDSLQERTCLYDELFFNTTNQFLKRQKISLQNDKNYYPIEIYLHHQIFLYMMKSNFLHDEKILIV